MPTRHRPPIFGNHFRNPGVVITVLKIALSTSTISVNCSSASVWWTASAGALKSCRRSRK